MKAWLSVTGSTSSCGCSGSTCSTWRCAPAELHRHMLVLPDSTTAPPFSRLLFAAA